ncbi:hypothetical protein Tco_0127351, partial [Tanacetum coccineum]
VFGGTPSMLERLRMLNFGICIFLYLIMIWFDSLNGVWVNTCLLAKASSDEAKLWHRRLESRVESLEKELSDTKQTLGTAVLKLIKKVKKLEHKLRQKRKREETENEEDAEDQDQDIPSHTDQGDKFATPEKSKDSGEAQAEQISPYSPLNKSKDTIRDNDCEYKY